MYCLVMGSYIKSPYRYAVNVDFYIFCTASLKDDYDFVYLYKEIKIERKERHVKL